MLLLKSNNLCGSGSGRIFALPLPQKKDRFHYFRFHIHGYDNIDRIKSNLSKTFPNAAIQGR